MKSNTLWLQVTAAGWLSPNEIVTEITANATAAKWLMRNKVKVRTFINIGGQDCKVIALDSNGIMLDFAMNDKCAAGTVRFLEVMSRVLEVELDEFGTLSEKAKDIPHINSLCTGFGESEVISLLSQGRPVEDIIAGIHKSIAKRVVSHGQENWYQRGCIL